ncbi:DEP domain-containing mTOR-interacting protein-like [Oscarella lobularis]|uniref:DEP domain-containing mTOR-interacting protein-like n=1 Tax=Oscarella lobularis TaxID=121494 RepID=UPI003313DEED
MQRHRTESRGVSGCTVGHSSQRRMDIMAIGEELRERLHASDDSLIKDRRYHLKLYPSCFVGQEVVDWLLKNREAESREQAVEVMRTLQDYNVLHHVCDDHDFKDDFLFYRFRKDDGTYPEESDAIAFARGQRLYSRLKKDKNMIKDRKYHLKTYKKCFVGKEFVDWLIANGDVPSRDEGVKEGRELLEAGVIHHVCDDHHFRDEHLFYRFKNDETEAKKFSDVLSLLKSMSPRVRRSTKEQRSRKGTVNGTGAGTGAVTGTRAEAPSQSEEEEATYTPMYPASSDRKPMPVPSPSEEPVAQPVTVDQLMASGAPFTKKTVKVASDPVGYGFVIRGAQPVHVHTVDPSGPAAVAGLTVGEYLVSVNGQDVLNSTHTEAARLILIGPTTATLVTMKKI